tara:strand:- start:133 stop:474 length:342 start_codon:yes stop_codon:yes gene_type:complete
VIRRLPYIFSLCLAFFIGCTKGDPSSNNSASQEIEMVVLMAYAGEGGWIRFSKAHKGRPQFMIVRPPGSEITVDALAAEGYYFDKWSNESTANPIIFTLNSDMEITAFFKQTK